MSKEIQQNTKQSDDMERFQGKTAMEWNEKQGLKQNKEVEESRNESIT